VARRERQLAGAGGSERALGRSARAALLPASARSRGRRGALRSQSGRRPPTDAATARAGQRLCRAALRVRNSRRGPQADSGLKRSCRLADPGRFTGPGGWVTLAAPRSGTSDRPRSVATAAHPTNTPQLVPARGCRVLLLPQFFVLAAVVVADGA